MTKRYSAVPRTMCLVFHEDEILMLKGSERKPWAGIYNTLGGHVEKGEDIVESAIREIQEESGLIVVKAKLAGVMHVSNFYGVDVMMFVVTSEARTRQVISNDEGELEWVKIADLGKLKTFADVEPIVEKVLASGGEKVFTGTAKFDGEGKLEQF